MYIDCYKDGDTVVVVVCFFSEEGGCKEVGLPAKPEVLRNLSPNNAHLRSVSSSQLLLGKRTPYKS